MLWLQKSASIQPRTDRLNNKLESFAEVTQALEAKLAPCAGHWIVEKVFVTLRCKDSTVSLAGVTHFYSQHLAFIADQIEDLYGSKHDDDLYVFTVPDDEVKVWLVTQIRRMAVTVGIELVDETGYEKSSNSLHAQADAEFAALVTESEQRYEQEQDKKPRHGKIKIRSVAQVLQAFHEMGCTEQELQVERTNLFFDSAYRRFWATGDWLDSA